MLFSPSEYTDGGYRYGCEMRLIGENLNNKVEYVIFFEIFDKNSNHLFYNLGLDKETFNINEPNILIPKSTVNFQEVINSKNIIFFNGNQTINNC